MTCEISCKGCDDMPGDENVQKIHQKMLDDNASAIAEFSKGFSKLEQQFDNLNDWMKGIAKEIRDFVEKTDKKYQTKEVCEMCTLTGEKQYTELSRVYESRIGEIKENHKKEIDVLSDKIAQLKIDEDKRYDSLISKLWKIGFGIIAGMTTVLWFLVKLQVFGVKG